MIHNKVEISNPKLGIPVVYRLSLRSFVFMGQETTPKEEEEGREPVVETDAVTARQTKSPVQDDRLADTQKSPTTSTERRQSFSSPSPNGEPPATLTSRPSTISLVAVTSFLKTNLLPAEKSPSQTKAENMLVRPAICKTPLKEITRFCLSLSGCGFLGSYHFGAMECFLKNGQHVVSRVDRVAGVSAGSLVGSLFLLAPEKLPHGLNVLYDMADELNSLKFGALTPGFLLNERLIKIVDSHLPEDIKAAQEKLYVSLTNHKNRENHLISNFPSRAYLIQCLLASCYIPMYSMGLQAQPPVIDGVSYIDGGYSNMLPDFADVRTITISPFSGSAEISPSDEVMLFDWQMTICNQQMKVNLQNIRRGAQALFPPNRQVLQYYHEQGFKDTFKFLLENGLIKRSEGTAV